MFYVYALLDMRKPGTYKYGSYTFTHEPFYIGKGKGKRCNVHTKVALSHRDKKARSNRLKQNLIRKIVRETGLEPEVVIKKQNLTEQQAFNLECKLIKFIGRRDLKLGPLANLSDGGEGPSGRIRPAAEIAKFSKSLKALYASDPEYKATKGKQLREANADYHKNNKAKAKRCASIGGYAANSMEPKKQKAFYARRAKKVKAHYASDDFNSRHHACLVGLGRLLDRFFYGKYKKLRPEFEQLTRKRIARKFQSKPKVKWCKLRRLVVRDIEQLFGNPINHKDSSFRNMEQERLNKNQDIGNSVSVQWSNMTPVAKSLRKACISMGMWVSRYVAEPDRGRVKSVLRDKLEKLIVTGNETWKDIQEKVLVGVAYSHP